MEDARRESGKPGAPAGASSFSAYCEVDGAPVEIDPQELSPAGLFVLTPAPLPLDREVSVVLRIAGILRFAATGHVVQSISGGQAQRERRKPGYALLFTQVDDHARNQLRAALASLAPVACAPSEAHAPQPRPPAHANLSPERRSSPRPAPPIISLKSAPPTEAQVGRGPMRSIRPDRPDPAFTAAVERDAREPARSIRPDRPAVAIEIERSAREPARSIRPDRPVAAVERGAREPARSIRPDPAFTAAVERGAREPDHSMRPGRPEPAPPFKPGQEPRAFEVNAPSAAQLASEHAAARTASERAAARTGAAAAAPSNERAGAAGPAPSRPAARPSEERRSDSNAYPPAASQPAAAAPAADAQELQVLAKLEAELAALESQPAWTILGVSQGASQDELRSAFFAASKLYHPHIYARYALPAIKDTVTELFIAYKRAFTTLSKVGRAPRAAASGKPVGRSTDPGNS